MNLRPALPEDGPHLWDWRNDPVARAASLAPDPIPLDRHLDWFARALTDPDRQILIALSPGPVGMVRFDRAGGNTTVSILLAPAARGRGLARPMLTGALALCRFRPTTLHATIRRNNAASLAVFVALGFQGDHDTDPITLTRTLT